MARALAAAALLLLCAVAVQASRLARARPAVSAFFAWLAQSSKSELLDVIVWLYEASLLTALSAWHVAVLILYT
jgi:hypothetical protein